MKKATTVFLALTTFLMAPFQSFSREIPQPVPTLLSAYYDIKNALVASDVAAAARAADAFVALIKGMDASALSTVEQVAFKSVQAPLLADASAVASAKEISKQRVFFQSLSENIIITVRASQLVKPAYIAYCPMKKAYWISAESGIRNPYYGSSMLTCGKVTETIK
ncbi:DUF3347 domain-containing protein [Flaviaesturariibacter flavus]|uniref:DUF3347 domain-containing protein n=1 Tax=Flaviaesturariibacter flavus TaxID=2502780 RepID=A0A4V2NV53_9BACT|nr:DUF3347 domain-containing protein [Flaviaesturariibacter flavus]TCJ12156.1 DUF3347 domain-containing protein [Flaviaesturariibacter flavus]